MADSPVLAVPQQFATGTSYQVRDELVDYVERDLLGPWEGPTEQFQPRARGPRDRYLVGMLGPKHNPRSTVEAASEMVDTEPGNAVDGDDGELREMFSVQNAGRIWASSMGLSFAVSSDVDVLNVAVSWGHYLKVMCASDDDVRRPCWVRHPVEHRVELRLDGEQSDKMPLANPGPEEQDTTEVASDAQPADGVQPQPADPDDAGIYLAIDVRDRLGPDGQPRRLVELALINAQLEPPANPDSAWLFQPCIQVTAGGEADLFLPTDDPLVDAAERGGDKEEQHLRLLYRSHLRFASGRNVAVHPDVRPGARRAWRLTTTWLPTYDVPGTVAPTLAQAPHLAGLELSMDRLAALDVDRLAAALVPLATGYAAWLDERAAEVPTLPEALRPVAHQAIFRARQVVDRITDGVALLRGNAQALDAFRFANDAMALQRRRTALAALREAEGLSFAEAETRIGAQGEAAAAWRVQPHHAQPWPSQHHRADVADLVW